MSKQIFNFSLHTETELDVGQSLFGTNGDLIGRILRKSPPFRGTEFNYDVESSKEVLEDLEKGTYRIYGIEKYWVANSNIRYTWED